MKRLFFVFLFFSCNVIVYSQDTISNKNSDTLTQSFCESIELNKHLPTFVNNTNNILIGLEILLGIVTLIIGIGGWYIWRTISKFDSRGRRLEEKIKKDYEDLKKTNEYFNRLSDQLYNTFGAFFANPKNTIRIYVSIQESKLFSLNEQDRISALFFFYQKGNKDNLKNLKFLAENDKSEEVRKLANQVIGIINYKMSEV